MTCKHGREEINCIDCQMAIDKVIELERFTAMIYGIIEKAHGKDNPKN